MAPRLDELRSLLATDFPLAGRLGVSVVRLEGDTVILAAPLEFNRNHEGTVFGGSLNAVATLAGWCAVWLAVTGAGMDGTIVIQDSAIRYRRPITTDFEARATMVPERRDRLLDALRRKGKGRITVDVTVGDAAVVFAGRYVVSR
jgi:thioesterase domain-containing protein